MTRTLRNTATSFALGFTMFTASGASLHAQQVAQPAPAAKHHSKIKGALVGAAAGHMLGGHAKSGEDPSHGRESSIPVN